MLETVLSHLKFGVHVCDFFLSRAHIITQFFPLLSSSRTTNHVQASRISSVTLLWNALYAIEHCFSSFEMLPLLNQLLNLTSHFQNIWPWSSQGKGLGNEVALVWGSLLCLQCSLWKVYSPILARLSSEFWEEVPVLFLKTLLHTTFSSFM